MQYQELTKRIIGCAFTVYNAMGFGYLKSVYEKCLLLELRDTGLQAEAQKAITVYYRDIIVGRFIADILVEKQIIVELKSVRQLAMAHEVQLVNYLVATGKDIGLLINFGEHRVTVKRKVREFV